MSKFRESLVDRMIRIYGFENPIVIDFCRCCETFPNDEAHDKTLRTLVITEQALDLAFAVGGCNQETAERILFYFTGWRSFGGFLDELED